MARQKKSTPKTAQTRSYKKRKFVPRGTEPASGSGNIIVKKRGEDLRQELQIRYQAMKDDLKKVEFFWSKIMNDNHFSETREWGEIRPIIFRYELDENVKTIVDYRNKMRRLNRSLQTRL